MFPRLLHISIFALFLSLALSGCGPRKNMEGAGDPDADVAETTDSSLAEENKDEATGSGDTTSFSDEEEVEKVDVYTVRRGDNLWDIAAKRSVYGSGWLYPLIVKANKDKIKDANDLKTGLVLTIPRGLPAGDYDIAREEAMAKVWIGPNAGPKEGASAANQAYSTSKPAPAPPAKKPEESKGGVMLWLVLILLAAALGWAWFRMKAKRERQAASAALEA